MGSRKATVKAVLRRVRLLGPRCANQLSSGSSQADGKQPNLLVKQFSNSRPGGSRIKLGALPNLCLPRKPGKVD